MPIIRRKFNQGAYYLNPEVVGDAWQLGGQTVDVKTARGFEPVYFAGFLGFRDVSELTRPVKIINVAAFSPGTQILWQSWTDYCRFTVLLGDYSGGGVYLCLEEPENLPRAWCPIPRDA